MSLMSNSPNCLGGVEEWKVGRYRKLPRWVAASLKPIDGVWWMTAHSSRGWGCVITVRWRQGTSTGGHCYDVYSSMSDLTVHLFIFDYRIWYQNGRIPKYVSWGIVTLLRKNLYKRDAVDNLRHITLLNTEINFLADVSNKFGEGPR